MTSNKHTAYHERVAEHFGLSDDKQGSQVKLLFFSLKSLVHSAGTDKTNEIIKTILSKIENQEPLVPKKED